MANLLKDPRYSTSYPKLIITNVIALLFMVVAFTYNIWLMQMIVYMGIWLKVVLSLVVLISYCNERIEKNFDKMVRENRVKGVIRSSVGYILVSNLIYIGVFLIYTSNIWMFLMYLAAQSVLTDHFECFLNHVDTKYTNKVRLDKLTENPNL